MSSKRETRYASDASWRAMTAEDWKRRSVCKEQSQSMTQRSDSKGNEQTNLEVLSDLTDEALEGELADEELGRLLVAADFTESDGSGPEAMGLLDTAGRGSCGGLARR